MGAFFLSPYRYDIKEVRDLFTLKGFGQPSEFTLGSNILLLYKKQLVNEINYNRINETRIFSVGTIFYKNKVYSESLYTILEDFLQGIFDPTLIIGSYFLLIEHEGQIYFSIDKAGIQNVFYSYKSEVISSSFIAVLAALGEINGKQKINKQSFYEILLTGNLIGPDTQIESIERLEPALKSDLPGMARILNNLNNISPPIATNNFSAEVDQQIIYLKEYFTRCSEPLDHYGVISGLTGGFDSRLLYLVMKRQISHYQIYSTFQNIPGSEEMCTSNFAQRANEKLLLLPHIPPEIMGDQELLKTIKENFYFNDGLIRTHQIWLEEIKRRDYLIKLFGNFRIGFSGVGGEQYRNGEYLLKDKYKFKSWVRNELIKRVSGVPFLNDKDKFIFYTNLQAKISNLLNIDENSKYISKKEIKRYYNEIWNPANRTLRNNIENQLAFFLSPFTDYNVSRKAYCAIPFLGDGPEFEIEMIRQLSPELADCKTHYGFSPAIRMSFLLQILPYIKFIFGLELFNNLNHFRKVKKKSYYEYLLKNHSWLKDIVCQNEKLCLSLNYEELLNNDFLSPLVIESGFFLTEMKKYIDI
jgi:hypothetical protein